MILSPVIILLSSKFKIQFNATCKKGAVDCKYDLTDVKETMFILYLFIIRDWC